MKRVLIDCRFQRPTSGVGRYLAALCRELEVLAPSDLIFELLSRSESPSTGAFVRHRVAGNDSNARFFTYEHQLVLPRRVRATGADLFHYPMFDPPAFGMGRFVATCYDLEPLRHPELFHPSIVSYYRLSAHLLRRAQRIIVISQSTANDVTDLLGVDAAQIDVAHLGVDPIFSEPVDAPEIVKARHRLGLPEQFALYVGNAMPHKNVVRLVQAMGLVRERVPAVGLVLVCADDKYFAPVADAVRLTRAERLTIRLSAISDKDLRSLYGSAAVLVQPSLYEGFGLPALEAMACGLPVVAAQTSSLPEIVGDAGTMVDPLDVSSIAQAISSALTDSALARKMSDAGRSRAAGFTWERTAERHVASYRLALDL